MIRLALLLASSALQSACSADVPRATSESTAAAHPANGATGRDQNQGTVSPMSENQLVITSGAGQVRVELVENDATKALLRMLPLTVEMRDHLRQEKTGNLPSALPDVERQTGISAGTLGLWGDDDFVIYYRDGQVPAPGVVILGRVVGNVAVFDRPGPVTVRIQRAD